LNLFKKLELGDFIYMNMILGGHGGRNNPRFKPPFLLK